MRVFEANDAVLEQVPLFVGLVGPSSSGKTFSALRLATGMQRVCPGPIIGIDTENRRMLHYANDFKFRHVDFGAPFASLDYLAALQAVADMKPSVIVVDSMSHEHEGAGGMVDYQSKELDRMAGATDYAKRERMQMLAWQKPKAARRALLQGITRLNGNVICCFRAGEKSKPVKNRDGKIEIVDQGFTAIAGDEFIFDMTMCALFPAGARGVPQWASNRPGELRSIKRPKQFENLFAEGVAMTEEHGEALARWAKGGIATPPNKRGGSIDIDALYLAGEDAARRGSEALATFWKTLSKQEKVLLAPKKDEEKIGWKATALIADGVGEAMGVKEPAGEMEIPF